MKTFNKTYLNKLNKAKTIRLIDFIYNNLNQKLREKFDLIFVHAPMFDYINSPTLVEFEKITRPINIDLFEDYQVITLYSSLSKWSQKCIQNYEIKENEGIIFYENSLWRDIIVRPNLSQQKLYLNIELVVSKEADKDQKIKEITRIIYKIIYDIANQLNDEHEIKNIFPKEIEFIETQLLENEFPNLSSRLKEEEMVQESNAFVLSQPGKQMFSGIIHSFRSNKIYDNDFYNEIHLLNEVDRSSINVAMIAYKKFPKELESEVYVETPKVGESKILYEENIREIVQEKILQTIEIKINLYKLYLALLKKGHIAEVQANVLSKEVDQLKRRKLIDPI